MLNSKILTILSLLAVLYVILCIVVYAKQKSLLFPISTTQPVPTDWQPHGATSEQATITGSCGQLHVAIWRSPGAKGTLMLHHGNGESLANIDGYADALLDVGYNLMAWDYPGYGQSTDCPFTQDMLLADAEHAYQWLAQQEKPENIIQLGYSLGTGIALSVAAKHNNNPVYLVAAYDALTNVAIDKMPSFIPVNRIFRYPMQTKQWVENINHPIYLIHGVHDTLIRPQHAQSLVDQFPGQVHIEWVENAGHADDVLFAYRNQWLKRLLP